MSEAIDIEIDVSVPAPGWGRIGSASAAHARRAAQAALRATEAREALRRIAGPARRAELAIVLADDRAVRGLNRRYRGIDKATNVLSFPASEPLERRAPGAPVMLGDVVLACETVCGEAAVQSKPAAAHLSHLVVHGTLHLLGYDHEKAGEARRMERLEAQILAGLGIPDPYRAAPRRRRARTAA